ncbi:hypothetical protein ABW21_db0203902 [Orbilia brochopaga]|nr:hypothetical protein ABW21_db0203902 [Drechslerella brochopaga]
MCYHLQVVYTCGHTECDRRVRCDSPRTCRMRRSPGLWQMVMETACDEPACQAKAAQDAERAAGSRSRRQSGRDRNSGGKRGGNGATGTRASGGTVDHGDVPSEDAGQADPRGADGKTRDVLQSTSSKPSAKIKSQRKGSSKATSAVTVEAQRNNAGPIVDATGRRSLSKLRPKTPTDRSPPPGNHNHSVTENRHKIAKRRLKRSPIQEPTASSTRKSKAKASAAIDTTNMSSNLPENQPTGLSSKITRKQSKANLAEELPGNRSTQQQQPKESHGFTGSISKATARAPPGPLRRSQTTARNAASAAASKTTTTPKADDKRTGSPKRVSDSAPEPKSAKKVRFVPDDKDEDGYVVMNAGMVMAQQRPGGQTSVGRRRTRSSTAAGRASGWEGEEDPDWVDVGKIFVPN